VSAYSELGKHNWYADNNHAQQIDKQKGTTAILSRHIWETPDASQTNSTTCRNKYCANFTSKRGSFAHM
jgi:hypothetical protein